MSHLYQTGYGAYQDRYDMLEADIDRRFSIFNTVTANKFLEYGALISANKNINNKCVEDIAKLQESLSFIMWKMSLPWYKKIYYKILNTNLQTIFNNKKNV